MQTRHFTSIVAFLLVFAATFVAQKAPKDKDKAPPPAPDSVNAAAEDISGMYTFLKEGEFLQINLEQNGVSGYISREGDQESDRGQFLDQFFSKASVRGHDVSFLTKPVHGVWFEFKGRFNRGAGKTRADDAYYILRGTLTEFRSDAASKTTSHSREVEFKSLAEPDES